MAIEAGWLWAGTDMSESVCTSEENLVIRLLADLAFVTSSISVVTKEPQDFSLQRPKRVSVGP